MVKWIVLEETRHVLGVMLHLESTVSHTVCLTQQMTHHCITIWLPHCTRALTLSSAS